MNTSEWIEWSQAFIFALVMVAIWWHESIVNLFHKQPPSEIPPKDAESDIESAIARITAKREQWNIRQSKFD